ncbi:hypothetical protein B7494_g7337 [Chlorociboria aeruginascens]|nr:hypothetical protein B7494_g7337 [Chlorociboria aeruginascens]
MAEDLSSRNLEQIDAPVMHASKELPSTLLQLLSTSEVLYRTAPYLPLPSLFALGATSQSFHNLIHQTRRLFRHLDLTTIAAICFRHNSQVAHRWSRIIEKDDPDWSPYILPVRIIFRSLRRQHILQDVRTLILDGCIIPTDVVCDIIRGKHFGVHILSLREVRGLEVYEIQQALIDIVGPSQLPNQSRLQGLYIFGLKEDKESHLQAEGNHDQADRNIIGNSHGWHGTCGSTSTSLITMSSHEWARVMRFWIVMKIPSFPTQLQHILFKAVVTAISRLKAFLHLETTILPSFPYSHHVHYRLLLQRRRRLQSHPVISGSYLVAWTVLEPDIADPVINGGARTALLAQINLLIQMDILNRSKYFAAVSNVDSTAIGVQEAAVERENYTEYRRSLTTTPLNLR